MNLVEIHTALVTEPLGGEHASFNRLLELTRELAAHARTQHATIHRLEKRIETLERRLGQANTAELVKRLGVPGA